MKTKAFIYIIIAGILWGTSGLFSNALAPYGFTPLHMTTMRGLVSCIGMSMYLFLTNRSLFRCKASDLIYFVPIGASLFTTAALYFKAMTLTSVSTAVVLMYMAPVYVMVFSVLFLGEKFSVLKISSLAAMLIGCCFVSGIVGGISFNTVGIILSILAGFCYAIYNIVTKLALQKGIPPITTTVYCFIFVTVIALSISKPHQIVIKALENPIATIPLLISLGVVTFIIPYFLYTLAMRDLPAGTAAALGIVEPMSATVFSVIFLKEELGILPAIGIALILGAVFALGKAEGKNEEKVTDEKTEIKEYELHEN